MHCRGLHGHYMIQGGYQGYRIVIIVRQRAVRVLHDINLGVFGLERGNLLAGRLVLQGHPMRIHRLQYGQ